MKKKNERAVTRVVIATGISSVVTQLLIIREFLAQFKGNEFVIALILFNWLFLGAVGTIAAHWITRRFWRPAANRLGWLSLVLAALPAVQILAVRMLRDVFFVPGASVGFYPTLAYTFFTIAPYCLLVGFVLPYSLFVIRTQNPDFAGTRIYITDNLGDVSGGALFSFALVYLVTPIKAVLLANLPLAAAAYFVFEPSVRRRAPVLLATFITLVIPAGSIFLESASLAPVQGKLAFYRESRYGRITVFQDQEQYTLFVGGSPLFSSQNIVTAEETIHYPLAQVPQAKQILLISAEAGMLAEVKKYQPDRVDYVELDPQVASAGFRFGLIKKVPGLHVIHTDGRAYLSQSDALYDAVIINLSEPDTFQINRFFTKEFFTLAQRRLAAGGVLSFSVKGFDNYLAEPQRQKLSSLYNTAAGYFKHVVMLPGQKIVFVCSARPVDIDIPARLSQKQIRTAYISGYFYGNLTAERIERLNALVDPKTPVNRDTVPYLMRLMFTQWFAKFATSPTGFIAALLVFTIVYLIRRTKEEYVLFATGCMVMGSEILVIFAFQIFFGYIYLQIGLIVTIFLAGLLPGAWLGEQLRHRSKQILVITDGLLIALMAIFILALTYGAQRLPGAFFLVFGFAVSLACGFQFPVALHLRGQDAPAVTRIFSADLMGAACGTLVTNVVLIPYCGVVWAAAGLIGLKLSSLMIMVGDYEKNN